MGSAVPRQVGLGCLRKVAEQASLCSVPASASLDDGLQPVNQLNPFLPTLLLVLVTYHSNRKQTSADGLPRASYHTEAIAKAVMWMRDPQLS